MTFDADSLGLVAGAVSLVRDLVHERLGSTTTNGRCDQMADRLAPLVTKRGFDIVPRLLLPAEVRRARRGEEWERVMDALSVPETYFWREIDQLQAIVDAIVPALVARAAPADPRSGACRAPPARSR